MWTISAGMHAGVLRINILPAARAWGRGGGRGHGGVGGGGGGVARAGEHMWHPD